MAERKRLCEKIKDDIEHDKQNEASIMNINGYTVSEEVERAANLFMDRPQFLKAELEELLVAGGVPTKNWTASRVADRLLQASRKRGEIKANGRTWERVK